MTKIIYLTKMFSFQQLSSIIILPYLNYYLEWIIHDIKFKQHKMVKKSLLHQRPCHPVSLLLLNPIAFSFYSSRGQSAYMQMFMYISFFTQTAYQMVHNSVHCSVALFYLIVTECWSSIHVYACRAISCWKARFFMFTLNTGSTSFVTFRMYLHYYL